MAELTHRNSSSAASDDTTVEGLSAPRQREGLNTSNPRGNSTTKQGVNVAEAEQEFHELNRQLSGISRTSSRGISRTQSRKLADPEKGVRLDRGEGGEDKFDLEDHLRGNELYEKAAGIRQKRIGIYQLAFCCSRSCVCVCVCALMHRFFPGVVWQDLTVSGTGGVKNFVATFPDAVTGFFNIFSTASQILGLGNKGRELDILKGFEGVLKPGEMCLVLGRPGSGCTTFLKVIANQRIGYTKVDGEVMYGRYSAETFAKRYRGESVYNEENDGESTCIS